MRRAAHGLALLPVPALCSAQQLPSVSPSVARLLSRDTAAAVWLFARPERTLDEITKVVPQLGGRLRHVSRWLHAVSADLPAAGLRAAVRRAELRRIQLVARFVGRPEPIVPTGTLAAPAPGAQPLDSVYGPSAMPFRVLNLLPLVSRGIRARGVRIAILDTGFETGLSVFDSAKVIAQRDFVLRDGVVRDEPNDTIPGGRSSGASQHGTATWSLLGANAPGSIVGIAPEAEYILAKTEDVRSETRVEEDNYVAALEWADSLGANVVSSSLGYLCFDPCGLGGFSYTFNQLDGDTAVTTVAVDVAAQRGITVVTAAGNGGPAPRTLWTPADAHFAIAVGATDSLGTLAGFSSRGPTADGRIKPELTAPGRAVFVATPTGFARASGTSFSTPLIAGAAALLKEIHPAFGPIRIRDALEGAGSYSRTPNSDHGWGTPNVTVAATFPRGITIAAPRDTVLATLAPLFAWAAADVPAFAQPTVRYDLRVQRAATGAIEYEATELSGTDHVPSRPLAYNVPYRWQVTGRLGTEAAITAIGNPFVIRETSPPAITLLFQNFPNPFPDRITGRRATCIWFDLSTAGPVRLDIADLRGHVVRNLVPGAAFGPVLAPGRYGRAGVAEAGCDRDLEWDGTAADGRTVPRGVYLVRLQTPDGTFFKRIVFLGPGV